MAKSVEFKFEFPPIQGFYDAGHGIIYMFGTVHENAVVEIINHETLHYVLNKIAGKRASLKLDKIYSDVEEEVKVCNP